MSAQVTAGWVRLDAGPDAYVAVPDGSPRGAVVAGAEMFGVNGHAREVCHLLAGAGYAVVAPDLYWRAARRLELGYDEAGRAEGRRLLEGLTREDVLADVAAALDLAQERAGRGGSAVVGLSMVGHIAVLAATRIPLDVAVTFYGGWTLSGGIPLAEPEPPLAAAAAIAAHRTFVLGFVGGRDFLISADEWQAIGERLTASGVAHELITYPDAAHGFANPQRPAAFDEQASADAWRRVVATLGERVAEG